MHTDHTPASVTAWERNTQASEQFSSVFLAELRYTICRRHH